MRIFSAVRAPERFTELVLERVGPVNFKTSLGDAPEQFKSRYVSTNLFS